jgi:hypothetical protein
MSLAITAPLSGIGMMLVAITAVWFWKVVSQSKAKWFWIGAALWTVAVLVKVVIALWSTRFLLGFLDRQLPHWLYVVLGGGTWGLNRASARSG